jgi:hypothetical protein
MAPSSPIINQRPTCRTGHLEAVPLSMKVAKFTGARIRIEAGYLEALLPRTELEGTRPRRGSRWECTYIHARKTKKKKVDKTTRVPGREEGGAAAHDRTSRGRSARVGWAVALCGNRPDPVIVDPTL